MKFVFVLSPGRTGTMSLAHFFSQNLPKNISKVFHERNEFGDFGVETPDITMLHKFSNEGNTFGIKCFWSKKFQRNNSGEYYVETSHVLAKAGLFENLLQCPGEVHVIVMRRNKQELIKSFEAKGDFNVNGNYWLYYLDPKYKNNITEIKEGQSLADWYIDEMEARTKYYMETYKDRVIFHELDTKDLNDRTKMKKLYLDIIGGKDRKKKFYMPLQLNQSSKAIIQRPKRVLLAMPTYSGELPIEMVMNLMTMKVPPGYIMNFTYIKRVMVDIARNGVVEVLLKAGYDYLLFLDDDTIPPIDALEKMLALDKDIVIPPVPARKDNGEDRLCIYTMDMKKQLSTITEDQPIGGGGMSCTLIKRRVIEEMAKKYPKLYEFETINGIEYHEDTNFCRRAKEMGFEIWGIHDVCPLHLGSQSGYQWTGNGIETFIIGY